MGARSRARQRAVDILFESDLRGIGARELLAERGRSPEGAALDDYTIVLVKGVVEQQERIDHLIAEHAEGWSLSRMPLVDRAVMRLGLYELLWADDVPGAVAIDEAVDLVKMLSTEESPRFVNGVLGAIARSAAAP